MSTVQFLYPYLEVFVEESQNPFLDIGITDEKTLSFKFYPSQEEIVMSVEQWEEILTKAKIFLVKSLENEETFVKFMQENGH